MAYTVKRVVNKTDAEVDVLDSSKKSIERINPGSSKNLPADNLLDLTFVSKTSRPVYIRIKSIVGDGDIGNGDNEPVEVVVGDNEEEEEDS